MTDDVLRKRVIAVLGARSSGKTSLLRRILDDGFEKLYHPTIHSEHLTTIQLEGTHFNCTILDTAGQDEFSIINSKHVFGVHGFILVYSVASQESFDLAQKIHSKIRDLSGNQPVPCVLVGTKTDLPERQVSSQEAHELASMLGAVAVDTSSKDARNTGNIFELCLREFEMHRWWAHESQSRGSQCTIM